MQKIIGLDIGSFSIKAVEIINRYSSYEISNFYENVIPQIDEISPDLVIPACMEQLFHENDLKADRIVTAMPGQYISSRILPFSFSDPHKIAAAVYAEIEDAVPFNLDDMIVDHQILGQTNGKTVALVVMTRKNFLGSFLDHLHKIDIDPKLVDVDSLAFYNLCPYLEMEEGKCYGLVDVGHEKTSVCLVQDGVLRMFRSINLGGRYITEFLARDLEVGFNEAQRIKHRVSRVLTDQDQGLDMDPADRTVADRITIASNTIVKELGRTLYAFKTWEKSPIEKIYLSGGTSVIRHFDQHLSNILEVRTSPNRLEKSDLKINPELSSQMSSMSQSIAIGLRAVRAIKRHSQINLRKGDFAYVTDYESVFRAGGTIFRVIAFALILLSFSYTAKYFSYKRQIADLQNLYKKELFAAIPELKKKFRSDRYDFRIIRRDGETELKDRIDKFRTAVDSFLELNSDSGSLVALEGISEHLPKDVEVNVVEYRYETKQDGTGKIRLRVEADSYDTIAKFEQSLRDVPVLQDITEKSSEAKPGSDIIVAVVEAEYMPSAMKKAASE
ncbi:MAG: pilus assembly protein PilM [Deltaproteobacteria bacterium]|nr:pilus assembly protein PilM [Deltaproteobacteria bacterium]